MVKPTKRQPARATIKDVAKAVGVSAMTVSNVINGRLQFVSPATAKRVERAIAQLKYRPQANARSLRATDQRSVGIVIVDEFPFFLADYFTCQLVAGLANVLNKADYTLTVQGMRGDQLADSMIMRSYQVAGFCAMVSGSPQERLHVIERLSNLEQPLIVFQEALSAAPRDVCIVRQDDSAGGRLIADHLLARRVKSYLVIVPRQGWPAIEHRVEGFLGGLATDSSAAVTIIESDSESLADVQHAMAAHLEDHPVPGAVFGTNDSIATAAMLHLLDKGHMVPDNVLVVGFNGFEAHRYSRPRLTTVQSVPYELGEIAGNAMLRRLAEGQFDVREYLRPVAFMPHLTT